MTAVSACCSVKQRETGIFVAEALLPQALELFVGSSIAPIRNQDELNVRSRVQPGAVFSLCPSRGLIRALSLAGYTHLYPFAAIPSHSDCRWLLPTQNPVALLAGTHIYEPHKLSARFVKRALIGAVKLGWNGGSGSNVLIASKTRLPLVTLIQEVTGESQPLFAFSLGRHAAVRKLTLQVMYPNGDILGYLKLPLTDIAAERVRHEANVLGMLLKVPALHPHVPRLLYAANWNGTYLLLQSALRGERGPLIFNDMHERFLRELWEVRSVKVSGQALIRRLAAKWDTTVRRLDSEWGELGKEVLQRATRDLQNIKLSCGLMHGDFAPWNTRIRQDGLLVFDWESADWEAPTSWDVFHFTVQASYFFAGNKRFQIPKHHPHDKILFMLYILTSISQFLEEENHAAVSHHKKLLVNAFHGGQEWSEGSPSAA
jgi:hypothetical protein